jgi:DNA polymerase (family 10)
MPVRKKTRGTGKPAAPGKRPSRSASARKSSARGAARRSASGAPDGRNRPAPAKEAPAGHDGTAAGPPPASTRPVDKEEVADVLAEISRLLDLLGENPFKIRAYENASRIIRAFDRDLARAVQDGSLAKTKGIGPGIHDKVATLVRTGRLDYHEGLRGSIPAGLLDLLRVPGLGPKKVRTLHLNLGVTGLDDLAQACRDDRLLPIPGFGKRSQEKILAGIERARGRAGRFLVHEARRQADEIVAALRELPAVRRVSVAGSLRRRLETVGDVDVLASVAAADRDRVMERFVGRPGVADVIGRGATKSSVRLEGGLQVDLRLVEEGEYPFALHYFTGSKAHNIAMRQRAERRGLKMNEYGLFREDGSRLGCADEAAAFAALDLGWIPPELREDQGEIEAAEGGRLPRLLEDRDLRGILHNHSTWSDGTASIAEMARAAEQAGFAYFGITDHGPSSGYANGLSPDQVARQHAEIDAWNREGRGIPILKGTEVDILPDGSLDYDDETLARFDFVVASIHTALDQPREEMTRRVLRALAHPRVTIWGHPTNRLLLERDPIQVDLERCLRAAAEHGVAVEINAHPKRLDLDWRMHRFARSVGAAFSIAPDAHRTDGVSFTSFGVGIARKGWVERDQVLNALPLEKLRKRLTARRG